MRIAIAGFNLESVTFLPDSTGLEEFELVAQRNDELVRSFKGTNTVPGGFIKACQTGKAEILPLVYSEAGAAAAATDEAFNHFLIEITNGIKHAGDNIDGLLLGLHGALVTETGKTDLDFIIELRKIIGDRLPIGVSFDLHGNLDPRLVEYIDVLSAYHESPHTDMGDTGERVGTFLLDKLKGRTNPIALIQKIPMTLPSIFTATEIAPLNKVMKEARRQERLNVSILDCSIVMGFAYADVEQIGMSILATSDNDTGAIKTVIDHMFTFIWEMRETLYPKDTVLNVKNGVSRAIELSKGSKKPAVVLEHADRMNDSTHVLKNILKMKHIRFAVPYLWDPEAAADAGKVGINNTLTLSIGGKSSNKAGGAIFVNAEVLWTGEPEFPMGGVMGRGRPVNLGKTAIIRVENVIIWLISTNVSAINLDPFEQFGFDQHDFDIVVLRSKTHFRAVWEKESCGIVIVDTPDWGPALLDTLDYKKARKGVFPIT